MQLVALDVKVKMLVERGKLASTIAKWKISW